MIDVFHFFYYLYLEAHNRAQTSAKSRNCPCTALVKFLLKFLNSHREPDHHQNLFVCY